MRFQIQFFISIRTSDPDQGSHTYADPDSKVTKAVIKIKLIFKFLANFMLLYPNPHSQYRSGSRAVKNGCGSYGVNFQDLLFFSFSFLSESVPSAPSCADTVERQALNSGHFCHLVVV
jgi:hypothetical protein